MMVTGSHSTAKTNKGGIAANGTDIKEAVIQILSRFREGKTINEMAELLHLNRQTVSKYILVLIAMDLVEQKEVGRSKLCYLKRVKK